MTHHDMMCDNPILSTSHKMKCKRRGEHRENCFRCSGDRYKFCCSIAIINVVFVRERSIRLGVDRSVDDDVCNLM